MKKILFTLLTISLVASLSAQNAKCGIDTRALVAEEVKAGTQQLRFIAKMQPGFDRGMFEKAGITFGAQAGNIVTMTVPVQSLALLDNNKEVLQYSISHHIAAPTCNSMRYDTRTNEVHSGEGVSNGTGYDGSNVYIGITDWGFDYTHPNLNTYGASNHRIDHAWDHFRLAGPAPEGYNYGTLISGYNALIEAKGDTSNLYGYGTHGTHVAGIAAGRGHNGNYQGQAPKARMLLCSFGLGEAEWMDAVGWMRSVAQDSARRLVVNSSWGMYSFSTLDGTSLLCQAIDNWSDEGIVFCTSAGNNGNDRFHIGHTFEAETPDTMRTLAASSPSYYVGNVIILWGTEGHDFEARIGYAETLSPYFSTERDTIVYDTLTLANGGQLAFRVLIEHENPFDHRPHIQFDTYHSLNSLELAITAQSGTVHAWNVANKDNHAGNEGLAFNTGNRANYTGGDDFYGIGEPACAAKCISVAAHASDWASTDTTRGVGDLTSFSSYGPLIDGTKKPEISAPGYEVTSSISAWTTDSYAAMYTMNFMTRTYRWARMSGTSMSSPAATGVVALILQANPALSTDQVRDIVFSTARNDFRTGPLVATDSMDVRWGWGKIDALDAVNEALQREGTLAIPRPAAVSSSLRLWPNPASEVVYVEAPAAVEVYSIGGLRMGSFAAGEAIRTAHWPKGIYIVRCGTQTAKLIVR